MRKRNDKKKVTTTALKIPSCFYFGLAAFIIDYHKRAKVEFMKEFHIKIL